VSAVFLAAAALKAAFLAALAAASAALYASTAADMAVCLRTSDAAPIAFILVSAALDVSLYAVRRWARPTLSPATRASRTSLNW